MSARIIIDYAQRCAIALLVAFLSVGLISIPLQRIGVDVNNSIIGSVVSLIAMHLRPSLVEVVAAAVCMQIAIFSFV